MNIRVITPCLILVSTRFVATPGFARKQNTTAALIVAQRKLLKFKQSNLNLTSTVSFRAAIMDRVPD